MTIKKELLGKEDINFGLDTYQRKSSAGTDISVSKVNASHLPIVDSSAKFSSSTVEGALAECQLEDAVGSNSKSFTNKSGSQRTVGDVVVIDTSNDESFTTTTTSGNTGVLGVVAETIDNNSSGRVTTGGYASAVAVDAVTSRGSFIKTSTSAGVATPSTLFTTGCFGMALSSSAGPGTVSALIFGTIGGSYLPLAGGTLSGMLELAKGADVASASALTLGDDGNYFDITGTATITSIASKGVGTVVTLHFDDALTLTYHATNLILPGNVDLITSAGDELTFIEYTSGGWRCVGYVDASITGTGNMVRATTPTLVTPKVDTINESTSANGVTVDGLNIKDGKLNTNNSVVTSNITNQAVDVNKASGVLGTWDGTKSRNTDYLASTDLLICASGTGGANQTLDCITDSSNPPTTTISASSGTVRPTSTFVVRKGDYWKVSSDDTTTIYIIPIGS